MSIVKKLSCGLGKFNIEIYNSANEVADDLSTRRKTDERFKKDEYRSEKFVGASREEAYKMLREGYQPIVEKLKAKGKASVSGVEKRVMFSNEPVGFAPIVPNAILGLPNSMINSRIKPIKTKVIDVFYSATASAVTEADEMIEAGKKLLSAIMFLESQGYRFNLYAIQEYYDNKSCDMLCVRVKNASQPLDLKRISFPVAHPAFFRGIGFEWYSKFPLGTYRPGYGCALAYKYSQGEISKEFKKMFGNNAVFLSCVKVMKEDEDYLRKVLCGGKMD